MSVVVRIIPLAVTFVWGANIWTLVSSASTKYYVEQRL